MKKFLLFALLVLIGVGSSYAQVTTSSLTGQVKDQKGEPLIGASVRAVHQPTGTVYGVSTKSDGRFTIMNMRAGGPYSVEVRFVGFQTKKFENINLKLAEPYSLNATISDAGQELEEVVVSASANSILNSDKNGAATNIGRQQIAALPTITRSVNDITRLTPQGGGPNGALAGGSSRANNFTVDGANFNNQFGIGQNMPAGGSPISLDALDQISINVTPFDVRQSGFTGGAINAVTKSGTNRFTGTAFYTFRNEGMQGSKVGDFTVTKQPYDQKQFGASLGGPIVKDKLFFFLNYERSNVTEPGQTKVASTAERPWVANDNTVARPTQQFMDDVRQYLMNNYQYDPGAYQGYSNKSNNSKFLARIDWNISNKHHLNVRYNMVESKSPFFVSTSVSGSGLSSYQNSRTSNYALNFANSNYFQDQNLYSLVGELNSNLGVFNNTFRGSWTHQNDPRSSNSSPFPFVDIMDNGNPLTSFGYEPFTYGNLRDVKTYSFVDELSATFGKHNLLAGIQFETSRIQNGFQRFGTGFYQFDSWASFTSGAKPSNYAITYPLTADGSQAYPSFKFNQWSFYLQDTYSPADNFKITAGIRFELPTYPDVSEMKTHPAVAALDFGGESINTGAMPKTRLMASPRIGFNWDINGDRSVQLRGGTGIFTGRIPFVWMVAQSGDSGMLQYTQTYGAGDPNMPSFSPDIRANVPTSLPTVGTAIPTSISSMSPNLKFPQTWKNTLALDFKLPYGIVGSIEGIYQKDINAVYARNANLYGWGESKIPGYADNRQVLTSGNTYANIAARNYNVLTSSGAIATPTTPSGSLSRNSNAIIMDNAKGGYYASITAQLSKQFGKNWSAMVAYTASDARNFGDQGGDQILNLWSYPYTVGNSNNPNLSYTSNVLPHRVIASVTYKKEYLKNLATGISLFYEGAHQGRFSYYYSSDYNNDGQTNDLIYIPLNKNELQFQDIAAGTSGYAKAYSAAEQADLFEAYINQDPYLKKHRGQYARRNGALMPWRNQVDIRITQDIHKNFGNSKNTLQLSLDIFNFGNLLNKDWGNVDFVNNRAILVPRTTPTVDGTVRPQFRLAAANGDIVTSTFSKTQTISSTYYMQLGLRYIFN